MERQELTSKHHALNKIKEMKKKYTFILRVKYVFSL